MPAQVVRLGGIPVLVVPSPNPDHENAFVLATMQIGSDGEVSDGGGGPVTVGSLRSVSATTGTATLFPATAGRKAGSKAFNNSAAIMYVREDGGTPSSSNFSERVMPLATYIVDADIETAITASWASADGNAFCTDYTS